MAEDSMGFGWTPNQHSRIANNGHMDSDWLVQASIKPTAGAKWELTLPSGSWSVVVGVGTTNAKFTAGLTIEGQPAFTSSAYDSTMKSVWANEFRDVRKSVQVTDGKLTLEFTHSESRI
jgi:hypothetical protein